MFAAKAARSFMLPRILVALLSALLVASLVAPAAALGADPSEEASPAPTPTATETPQAPTPAPTETAAAAPEATPTQTTEPSPSPAAGPTPAPTTEPTAEPTPATLVAAPASPAATPSIASDKADYAPGELVTLSGAGWQPSETVHIYVNDDWGSTWSRNVDVVADESGAISDQFTLPGWFVATYAVVASAQAGVATTTFTDGNVNVRTDGTATEEAPIAWRRFTNTTCSGSGSSNVTFNAATSGNGTGIPGGASSSESLRLTAGSIPGYSFANWSNGNFVNANANPACLVGDNSTQNVRANYVATTIAATSLSVASATGTFGGTVNLSATLTAGASAVTGKVVSFSLNGTAIGIATTNASGVAAVTNASLAGINAGTYGAGVSASFAGDSNYSSSNGTAALTVNKAAGSVTIDNIPASATFGSNFTPTFTKLGDGTASAVSLTSVTCTMSSGVVSYVGAGTCTLRASVTAGANYNAATGPDQSFTISRKSASVTPAANGKIYGAADPILTGTLSGFLAADGVTATYSRTPGETVAGSPYTISATLSPAGVLANYDITYNTANFTIGVRAITVAADPQGKVYGNADPALTYQVTSGSLAFGDAFTGSLVRDTGEAVGSYAIRQSTLALSSNYALTFEGASFVIGARPITVTADPQTKTYGDADPALTYDVTSGSLAFSDAFSGVLERDAGESVGSYGITQGTLALNANYVVTFVGDTLTINPRPIAVAADPQGKIYGDADPALTYQITSGSLAFSDVFSGAPVRDAGENVGSYAIRQGTLALSTNYALTFENAALAIGPRPVTVTADAGQGKTYGDTDAVLTYHITSGSLAFGDVFSGAIHRAAGEDVGSYLIDQGGLALGTNYTLTFVGETFIITARPISVTADAKSKTYGNADPSLTYQITAGSLAFSDAFSGALVRDAGEDVGSYAIRQGSLALSSNYTLSFNGASFVIGQRPITVSADAKSKTYGDADPALTYQITAGSLVFSDTFSGGLHRAAGENAGSYAIEQGSLALSTNYALTFASATFTIAARPITLTADSKTKIFGSPDPVLTYHLSSGTFVGDDHVSGAPTRDAGEAVGSYVVRQGTLTAGPNYAITFVTALLVIQPWSAQGLGFYQPVGVFNSVFVAAPGAAPLPNATTVWNTAKGGSTIPLKFNVFAGTVEKTSLSDIASFTQTKLNSCAAGAGEESVDNVGTAGSTSLRYDTTSQQWIQNWKTPATNTETCYRATVTFADGSTLSAFFKLKK